MTSSVPDGEWVVALDIGGSGSRLVARRLVARGVAATARGRVPESSRTDRRGLDIDRSPEPVPAPDVAVTGRPVAIRTDGSDAADVVTELLARLHADASHVTSVRAAAVGATGLASLVRDPAELHAALRAGLTGPAENDMTVAGSGMPASMSGSTARGVMLGPRGLRTAVAADAVTAHLGALGGRPGAVVAVGTGAIALGTDLRAVWHRVDGWGHLLGDLGSGSWIGTQGLRAAVAAHDGRDNGGSTALLAAATARLGPVHTWPSQLYTRPDRAQVLASFTPDVASAAHAGDTVARQILAGAGTHLATTLAAALVDGVAPLASATGGVLGIGPLLTDAFRARFAVLRPDVELVPAAGTPLDGALHLAERLATDPGSVVGHEPWLTLDAPATLAASEQSAATRTIPVPTTPEED